MTKLYPRLIEADCIILSSPFYLIGWFVDYFKVDENWTRFKKWRANLRLSS